MNSQDADGFITVLAKKKSKPSKNWTPSRTPADKSTIVLKSSLPGKASFSEKTDAQKQSAKKNSSTAFNSHQYFAAVDATDGNAVEKVSLSLAQNISSARQAKKWTQEDLAKHSQIPLPIIRSWEKSIGNAVFSQQYYQQLVNTLGSLQKH